MRLPRRGTDPKADARGSRQLPWRLNWGSRPAERRRSMPASVVSAMRSVGRSLVFPAPSVAFDRHRSGAFEDTPEASLRRGEPRRDRRSVPFALSFEASARCRVPRGCRPTPKRRRHRDPASPGVRDLLPLHRSHPSRVHSRGRDALATRHRRLRRALGPTAPPVQPLVPTSWFRTTSPVSSARRTAGLLHPAAGPGVRRVALGPLPPPRHRHREGADRVWRRGRSVARDASTLRRVPPVPSRTVSPPPVLPPCRRTSPEGDAPAAPRCREAVVTSFR
jgi:hypothetical protein